MQLARLEHWVRMLRHNTGADASAQTHGRPVVHPMRLEKMIPDLQPGTLGFLSAMEMSTTLRRLSAVLAIHT